MSEKAHLFAIGHPGEPVFYVAVTEEMGVVDCGTYECAESAAAAARWFLRDSGVKVARKVTSMGPREFIQRLEARKDGDE